VKYRFDSYRASYRYVFYERERWSWSGGATLNIRDAEIRLQQGTLTRVEKNTGVVPLLALEGRWRFAPAGTSCSISRASPHRRAAQSTRR